jgi:hypothetical protein
LPEGNFKGSKHDFFGQMGIYELVFVFNVLLLILAKLQLTDKVKFPSPERLRDIRQKKL